MFPKLFLKSVTKLAQKRFKTKDQIGYKKKKRKHTKILGFLPSKRHKIYEIRKYGEIFLKKNISEE